MAYDYNAGYATGDALVKFAQLLRQGIGDYQGMGQADEEKQRKQQEYLLKLQALLEKSQEHTDKVQQAATHRSAISKFLGISPTMEVTSQTAAPVDRLPQDANDLQPPPDTMALTQTTTQPRDFSQAFRAANLTPDQAVSLDEKSLATLKKLFPGPKPPLPSKYASSPLGIFDQSTGQVTTPMPEKPPTPTLERDYHAIATSLLPPGAPESAIAAKARELRQADAVATAAATGENAARTPLLPADAPRPVQPALPSSMPPLGGLDRNPDFREAGGLSVPRTSSVAQAAARDLFGGQPAAPAGETVTERKTRLADEAALGVKQRAPVGESAVHYVLKDTGLPPPPDMPLAEVQKHGVAVSQAQMTQLGAARRGLSIIRQFEDPAILSLFPENISKDQGLLGTLANAARAQAFGPEAKVRAKSDPRYAKLVTAFATAIPALAKATGEVGNLSELEQQVVKDAIGITRTRDSFKAGIDTYRAILERAFKANGIPVPTELRGSGEGPSSARQPDFRYNPATGQLEPVP